MKTVSFDSDGLSEVEKGEEECKEVDSSEYKSIGAMTVTSKDVATLEDAVEVPDSEFRAHVYKASQNRGCLIVN